MIIVPCDRPTDSPLVVRRADARKWERADGLPFFRFGNRERSAGEPVPLGIISGGLILDSGEAEQTFIFRCQDRYLVYTSLYGIRSILFVADDEHAGCYKQHIAGLRDCYDLIAAYSGVLPRQGILEPIYVGCDIDTPQLFSCRTFERQVEDLRRSTREGAVEIILNQVSPTYAALAEQLDLLLRTHGIRTSFDCSECDAVGDLALRFHNKARYVALVRESTDARLPRHVSTAVLPPRQFLSLCSWRDLVAAYRSRSGDHREPAALFVKSSQDSSGNASMRFTAANFRACIGAFKREVEQLLLSEGVDFAKGAHALRNEVASAPSLRCRDFTEAQLLEFKRRQARRRQNIDLLVQPEVRAPREAQGRCRGIGVSCLIHASGDIDLIGVAAQVYKDPDRRHYLGSLISDEATAAILTPAWRRELLGLCELFAQAGYRGPINFDACMDQDRGYVLIYDCNPRLTAIFPPLAVRTMLRREGLRADAVLSMGYRGEFVLPDLACSLAAWRDSGLLYTRTRQEGVIVLPNLSRAHGFDVLLVNKEIGEVEAILGRLTGRARSAAAAGPRRIYY